MESFLTKGLPAARAFSVTRAEQQQERPGDTAEAIRKKQAWARAIRA
jgi:hypothetical protein